MNYSSAIWARPEDSLEDAQIHKLDLICRKLQLRPSDQVLEIGCGWGAFALYAAHHYGAHVTALTLSPAQYDFVTQLAAATLEPGSVQFLLQDYRTIDHRTITGKFDKIVSIEMFEAVGLDRYDEFFNACDRLLTRDGSMLLQLITLPDREFALPQTRGLDSDVHFPGQRARLRRGNSPRACPLHPNVSGTNGKFWIALCAHTRSLARTLFRQPEIRRAPRLRRALSAHVGILSRLVRRRFSRALHQRRATGAGEKRHATPAHRRSSPGANATNTKSQRLTQRWRCATEKEKGA
jgi:precorrin-6B methylase 2